MHECEKPLKRVGGSITCLKLLSARKSFKFLPTGQVISDEHHALFWLLESPRKKKFENAAASARDEIKEIPSVKSATGVFGGL